MPPLQGYEEREELRRHRTHTGASEQDPEEEAPVGLGGFCLPKRDPGCEVLSQQGKCHFHSALN